VNTAWDWLFRVEEPWIRIGPAEPESAKWTTSSFYSAPGLEVCARHLLGRRMRTTKALMAEIAAAFQFFAGFGENWSALDDSLPSMYLELPADAYIVVINGAEELLRDEPVDETRKCLQVFNAVGAQWSVPNPDNGWFTRKALPFHVLFNVQRDDPAYRRLIEIAGESDVPVRTA
jgi:hypothetical protein